MASVPEPAPTRVSSRCGNGISTLSVRKAAWTALTSRWVTRPRRTGFVDPAEQFDLDGRVAERTVANPRRGPVLDQFFRGGHVFQHGLDVVKIGVVGDADRKPDAAVAAAATRRPSRVSVHAQRTTRIESVPARTG